MKFIKSLSAVLLLLPATMLLLFSFNASSQTELDLKTLIKNAFDKNKNIAKLNYTLEGQESVIRSKYGSLFPTLTFNSGWTRTNQVSKGTQNVGGYVIDLGTQNTTTNNYNLSLRSDVTLFNGMTNYDNIELAKMQESNYYTQRKKLKTDIVLKLLSDYIAVMRNKQTLKINEASLEDAKAQLEKIKIFVEVGMKTRGDIYKQDALVAQNELTVEQSKNAIEKSVADLVYDAELPQDKNYTVRENEFATDLSVDAIRFYVDGHSNTDMLVSTAMKNRLDYKSSLQTIELNKQSIDIIRGTLIFPTLSGFGSYSLSGDKFSNISNSRVFTVGLNLSFPIFQGFSVDNQRQQAEVTLKSSNEDVRALKNQITLDIKKSLLDIRSLAKQIELAERSIKAAEQDKYLAEESYKAGLGTLLDVNTATVAYSNALIKRSNLIFDFILAQKQLEYYQGILKY